MAYIARNRFAGAATTVRPADEDRLLDRIQLAKKMGVSIAWVNRAIRTRAIPYLKVGKLIRFDWCEVKDSLSKESPQPSPGITLRPSRFAKREPA